jgi:hypothetical protein
LAFIDGDAVGPAGALAAPVDAALPELHPTMNSPTAAVTASANIGVFGMANLFFRGW